MSDTQLAAQMYTLREHMKTPADMAVTLKKVRELGYRAVQLSGHGAVEPAEMKAMVDDADLTVCATHESYPSLREDIATVIEKLKLWDCPNTAIGGLPPEYRDPEGYKRFAAECVGPARALKDAGIRFGYHNHSFELARLPDGRTALETIAQDSDVDAVMMEIDTYWIQHGGGDPAEYLRTYTGRVPFIHVKDMVYVPPDGPTYAEVGRGNLNWPAIVDAAKTAGVEWYIVEQDTCPGDPFESLKISLENLQAMGLS
jgi:sugar phosphate isomerase/epimerase